MRFRPLTWLLLSLLLFLAGGYVWRLSDQYQAGRNAAPEPRSESAPARPAPVTVTPVPPSSRLPLVGAQPAVSTGSAQPAAARKPANFLRVTNTAKSVRELTRTETAVLLENALIDTAQPVALAIPDHLRARGEHGSYIVQSRGPTDDAFRAFLQESGAQIVSYLPNNAWLVRLAGAAAQAISANPQVQSVLPYEPYYKLKRDLLKFAVANASLPENTSLDLTLFANARETTIKILEELGVTVIAEDRSPFGPLLTVRPPADALNAIAALSGVQGVARFQPRVIVNDLSRVRLAVSTDTVTTNNYLGLTGTNVLVNINDSGVDETNPDLTNRVFADFPLSLVDTNGHGTHVWGIIGGSGVVSFTVTNAQGSILPATNGQFRGKAPAAKAFSMTLGLNGGPFLSDTYLQETAARTNAFISNNSWGYQGDASYSIRAATYDAAVRDALPGVSGSQPLLYVFAAGNSGFGTETGEGGEAGSILAPATAKNVISVGAIEQFRGLTNETIRDCMTTNINGTNVTECTTNQPFVSPTDSDSEVAGFSSRGNVGIGIEGEFGRFKPDLVAPGTFVVSTRSAQWDQPAYYNPTNYRSSFFLDQSVVRNSQANYAIFVPENAVGLEVTVFPNGNTAFPPSGLPIYLRLGAIPTNTPGGYDAVGINQVSIGFPPNTSGSWFYSVGNDTSQTVSFDLQTVLTTTNDAGNFFQVLSNMNNQLGPYYRYESGTSMAAPMVSGALALMQEFFEQRLHLTNSPALMKALLINGARSSGNQYDFQVRNLINLQGWGVLRLTNSLPPALTNLATQINAPTYFFDQATTNGLATGQQKTRFMSLTALARTQPLRATLAWTDPPGNPIAGVKLVNDLDLVVTNLQTGQIFWGNDIRAGNDFNQPWDTNLPPLLDVVNNIENVYLPPPLGSNYSITVIGRRVNVNADTASTNTAQDYALVISSGDGLVTNALTLTTNGPIVSVNEPLVTVVTNGFGAAVGVSGSILLGQHVGANPPLVGTNTIPITNVTNLPTNAVLTLGVTNQWHFYIITNDTIFTNVAFITFLPPTLSLPRMGAREDDPENATRVEADIDLYVSTTASMTNLDPVAVSAADKSVRRGGTEFIVYSNSTFGAAYYIGVKSEDQAAAEYGFIGVFSELPFTDNDNGNFIVRGFPVPAVIPDGSPASPQAALVLALAVQQVKIRRVVVTNTVTHENFGDLLGNLSHGRSYAVLNNHTFGNGFLTQTSIYDDSGEADLQLTDGPGSLRNFVGQEGLGLWQLTMVDNAISHTGRVEALMLRLEPQLDAGGGFTATVQPGGFAFTFVDVPPEATNLTVTVSGNSQPVQLFIRHGEFPTLTDFDRTATIQPPGGSLSINKSDLPPLTAGRYFIGVFNPLGNGPQTIRIVTTLALDLAAIQPILSASTGTLPLVDDAVTTSSLFVSNDQRVASVDVGVRLDHPRESDLVLHLTSARGTRVLLAENRGGADGGGFGSSVSITNVSPQSSNGGPGASTNVIDTSVTSGTLNIDYDFFSVPDTLHVYYEGALIFDSGAVSNAGTFTLNFGPGASTLVTIIVNEGGNTNATTMWNYTAGSVQTIYSYAVFTENTNVTQMPIKFATPPFALTPLTNILVLSNSFEGAPPATYVSVTNFDGWTVETNQVAVTNDPPNAHTGQQYLHLGRGKISRVLSTVPNRNYFLSFYYRSNTNGQARVSMTPGPAKVVTGSTNWQLAMISFTGQGGNAVLAVEGLTNGLLLDTVVLEELAVGSFYLPEESLDVLTGENARGDWQLEIWDNRVGAAIVAPQLLSWQLRFTFQTEESEVPPALVHGVALTNIVSSNQIFYFVVDVPPWASFATNLLITATAPLDVLFNQTTPPTGANPGDFTLLLAATNGSVTLDTNGVPPLLPGQRYYLGVRNPNPTNVTFVIQVDFDITGLTNAVPFTSVLPAGGLPRYFYYDVSTNATAVSFQLLNLTGNLSLIASRGAPLPTFFDYDYGSFNSGSNDEDILIFTNSSPVALSPGRWYLGVLNADLTNVTYTILATELTNVFPTIITLANGVPYPNVNAGGSGNIDYYHFVVPTNAVRGQFEINVPSGDTTLVARQGLPLPNLGSYDLISANGGTNDELLELFDFSSPVALTPGDWFLSAVNVSGGPVSYEIKATTYPVYGTNLVLGLSMPNTNTFCISWNSLVGVHYTVQGRAALLTPGWSNVATITATSSQTTHCITLPSPYFFFRVIE